jgi:hypothetical protein
MKALHIDPRPPGDPLIHRPTLVAFCDRAQAVLA